MESNKDLILFASIWTLLAVILFSICASCTWLLASFTIGFTFS